jgi:hypothetical protein
MRSAIRSELILALAGSLAEARAGGPPEYEAWQVKTGRSLNHDASPGTFRSQCEDSAI